MRNLLIGAVSAAALIAGSALAADYQSGGAIQSPGATGGNVIVAPGTSGSTNWSGTTTVPSGTAGMSDNTGTLSGTTDQRRTRAINPGVGTNPNSALESQRATGTHCPPGTPNCRPGTLGGQ